MNIGIIPARYASTRIPGKPLADIGGISMIRRVYEQVSRCKVLNQVIVATDDERILNHVHEFGGTAMMTSAACRNGTERCGEIAAKKFSDNDVVVNIQGDEPFLDPLQIQSLIELFSNPEIRIGTLIKKIKDEATLHNPSIPKVVTDENHKALYFSRYPIPYVRDDNNQTVVFYKHIGLYAYRVETLKQLMQLSPTMLEMAESLEQLRWLEHGFPIHTAVSEIETLSVDTPEDLLNAILFLKNRD